MFYTMRRYISLYTIKFEILKYCNTTTIIFVTFPTDPQPVFFRDITLLNTRPNIIDLAFIAVLNDKYQVNAKQNVRQISLTNIAQT